MKTVEPVVRDLPGILARIPPDRAVVMLNLLRYRERAAYEDGTPPCSGREAYARYGAVASQTIAAVGGSIRYMGSAAAMVIAPPDEAWHDVVLVRYPSIAAFMRMLAMPEYQAAAHHRRAALDDSRLVATIEATP
jgi:uncharacterized protein (DUF1330 family)